MATSLFSLLRKSSVGCLTAGKIYYCYRDVDQLVKALQTGDDAWNTAGLSKRLNFSQMSKVLIRLNKAGYSNIPIPPAIC